MVDLPPEAASDLSKIRAAYERPARRPVFFAVLGGLTLIFALAALLARQGTVPARGGALLFILLPPLALALRAWMKGRRPDRLLRRASHAVGVVDPEGAPRLERAVRTYARLKRAPGGESLELSELHVKNVLSGVSLPVVERAGRERGRRLRFLALGLLGAVTILALGWLLPVVEGLDVLLARRGVAPFELGYLDQSDITAELPAHLGLSRRQVPIVYESVVLPEGSEVTWRMVPRASGRNFVLSDGMREAPFVSDGQGAWVARLVVTDPSILRVAARFGEVKIHDREGVTLSTVPDRAPTVTLIGGAREVSLTELERLSFEYVASDDYGLSVIELSVESGSRQEHRELARLDGSSRSYRGAAAVSRTDAILKDAFLPVTIRVRARDGDAVSGPKWGESAAIIVRPDPLGADLSERHLALRAFRTALVHRLAAERKASSLSQSAARAARQEAARALTPAFEELERRLHLLAEVPRGSLEFLRTQLGTLTSAELGPERAEAVLLATDVLLGQLSRSDAERLSKELGDAVSEILAHVRSARSAEKEVARTPIWDLLFAVTEGAGRLREVGELGLDIGSVAEADLGRARRLLEAGHFEGLEAVLAHLAARLHRATPSFGARGGSVEGGAASGRGMPGDASPSRAPGDYGRLVDEFRSIARSHESALGELERLIEEATRAAEQDAAKDPATEATSEELRQALEDLPSVAHFPGSVVSEAAQARGHGESTADALDAGRLREAAEAGRRALEALERAKKLNEQAGYFSRETLEKVDAALRKALQHAQQAAQKAPPSLVERALRERELGRAAEELGRRAAQGPAPLPESARQGLEKAAEWMKQAAEALDRGEAHRGRELSRRAQDELERAEPAAPTGDSRAAPSREDGGGEQTEAGHAEVPGKSEDPTREFRRRVERGLGREAGRFGPAVRRYVESLK